MVRRGLESYYGRAVKGVRGSNEGRWQIVLEGDVLITNLSPAMRQPEIPEGFVFTECENVSTNPVCLFQTIDRNGNVIEERRVAFQTGEYELSDVHFSQTPWNPMNNYFDPETPPHPDERAAEGPEPSGEEENE